MSESSDSEEFFDAEDDSFHRSTRRGKVKESPALEAQGEAPPTPITPSNDTVFVKPADPKPLVETQNHVNVNSTTGDAEDKPTGLEKIVSRRKFRELRQRMETEDDDIPINNSPPDSQTSSIEGVYPTPSKTSHPFRIIEHDTLSLQSMTSLGRVGRILGGGSDAASSVVPCGVPVSMSREAQMASLANAHSKDDDSASGKISQSSSVLTLSGDLVQEGSINGRSEYSKCDPKVVLQEPDVIASTKNNGKSIDTQEVIPVAPPRRKKKSKPQTPTDLAPTSAEGSMPASSLPSPASTIESITREFEHSLDIRSATKGQYVVKPQASFTTSNYVLYFKDEKIPVHCDTISPSKGFLMTHRHDRDEDKSKAEGPSSVELDRLEKIKAELLSLRSSDKSNSPIGSISSNSIGRYSLGQRFPGISPHNSRERRKSAGDQDMVKQLNMFVRTRTDSGKRLTDMEILEQVTVLNLDTGERVPLSIAEDKLPQCMNPLSLHIMRLTSEYVSNSSLEKEKESDEESVDSKMSSIPPDEDVSVGRVRKKTQKFKRFLGSTVKKTMDKAKSIAQEVSHARHKEDVMDIVDDVYPGEPQVIKLKASNSHKGPYEFSCLQHVQDLSGEHVGPVWCMKFSACGRLLATAGQDRVLRIWVLRDAFTYFQDMRTKYNAEKVSPTPSQESLVSQQSMEDPNVAASALSEIEGTKSPFMPKPFCTYLGHTSDLLDVSWSKNYFILSSSMDKTVRLWHISRKECLCCFQHIDFVTAIVFHPKDDRYFLSGSLDGKLRLWNIPDKKVAVWNEVDGQTKLITAANFCQNGKFAVVGSYDGRCIFYNTDQLKYHTQIDVRSTRGKNSRGRKISGIEPMPGEDKILVTSNDSRIRLYDLRDLNLSCKYKGYENVSSQIKASFSPDGQYIVAGSENQCIYIWKTHHDYSKFSSVRRDRNDFWEGIKAHNAVVTCAVFAPNPDSIIRQIEAREQWEGREDPKNGAATGAIANPVDPVVEQRTKGCGGHVLVSADFNGCIKVFLNKTKPKHSSLPASALA
ncbi:WD repeat-containing protein 44 isoform X1 [Diachasma alloeum]|uniref:WD repeat-containing protein 44 isoform X1 n=1 Tax=Diachasma alloeum TaxID=454923 RepID=UPI0007381F05|nr:WD repeat-containing protein 44 isoform X1 [Diachasma alloeum]